MNQKIKLGDPLFQTSKLIPFTFYRYCSFIRTNKISAEYPKIKTKLRDIVDDFCVDLGNIKNEKAKSKHKS